MFASVREWRTVSARASANVQRVEFSFIITGDARQREGDVVCYANDWHIITQTNFTKKKNVYRNPCSAEKSSYQIGWPGLAGVLMLMLLMLC